MPNVSTLASAPSCLRKLNAIRCTPNRVAPTVSIVATNSRRYWSNTQHILQAHHDVHGSSGSRSSNAQKRQQQQQNEQTRVIIFHKPSNCVTSHKSDGYVNADGKARTTVYEEVLKLQGYIQQGADHDGDRTFEDITEILSPLSSIGRLDADTTGLLLLTNDGGLVHHVTNPTAPTHQGQKGAIPKTYEALIMGRHEDPKSGALQQLWDGVDIGAKYGGMTRPVDDLQVLNHPSSKTTLVSITISEGKNRQVRRIFHAIGSGVIRLQRTKIGTNLTLGDLQVGQWRMLDDEEIRSSLAWEPRDLVDIQFKTKVGPGNRPTTRNGNTSTPADRRRSSSKRRTRRR